MAALAAWAAAAGAATAATETVPGRWDQLTPMARLGPGAVMDATRNRWIVFGGWNEVVALNDLWSLSLSPPLAWSPLAITGVSPSARFGHSMIYDSIRDRILMYGGFDNLTAPQGDIWALSLNGAPTWTQIPTSGPAPAPRYGHSAVYDPIRDRMIVFGGYSGRSLLNDTWELDLSATQPMWARLAISGAIPAVRDFASAIFDPTGDQLILFGGNASLAGELAHPVGDTWTLSLAGTPQWTQLSLATPGPRESAASCYDSIRHQMVVVGGIGPSGPSLNIWALQLGGAYSWSQVLPSGAIPVGRHSHVVAYDPASDNFVMFGGSSGNVVRSDTWSLNRSGTPGWTGMAAPPPRMGHSVSYDGLRRQMLLFGGSDEVPQNDVWSLALGNTPKWSKLLPAGTSPTPRRNHSAIVDPIGDRLVVFGGTDGGVSFSDTWGLSLAGTPTWSSIVPTGAAPSPREAPASIYDPLRRRLIVHGGFDVTYNANPPLKGDLWALSLDGAGSWTQLLPAGTRPQARVSHTFVYDSRRDQLLLFGGTDGNISFGDVWSLTLSVHMRWTPVATTGNGPGGLFGHGAIYDPLRDRMVVFGGYNGTAVSNSVYELALSGAMPTWSVLLPDGGPPAARDFPAAAYDPVGDRMVLVGGDLLNPNPTIPQGDTWALTWGQVSTPVLTSLVEADVSGSQVHLVWYTPVGAGLAAIVYRKDDVSDWESVGTTVSDGSGRLVFDDVAPSSGRFAYRLGLHGGSDFTDAAWIVIGSVARFSLDNPSPNPTYGKSHVAFSLAGSQPAEIQMVDVSGRIVFDRSVSALGPGPHSLDFTRELVRSSGVYVIRLTEGKLSFARKIVLLP